MADETAGTTCLLINIGHVLTRVAYCSPVEGVARLVALAEASTTASGPDGLLEGVRRAVTNLEVLLGRRLLDEEGRLRRPCDADGHGVGGAVVTTSLAWPLRVALAGVTRDYSLASAFRAVSVPHVTLVRMVALDASTRRWETDDLQALVESPPAVLVLVGGVDGGPVAPICDLAQALGAAYSALPENTRPTVVYAGNVQAHRPLSAALSGVVDLHLVSNVRPSLGVEYLGDLRAEVMRLFYRRALGWPEALQAVEQWAGTSVRYDLDAMARTLRFTARRHSLKRGVLGVDVGGSGCRLLWVQPVGAPLSWATPYGTGAGLGALRELNDPTAVLRWLRSPLSWAEAWDRLSNVEVRPAGVPQTEEDWDLQQAAAREALHCSWRVARGAWGEVSADLGAWPEADLLVGRGTVLTHAHTPGQAALAMIDALQPVGLMRLALDWADLLPGLSGLAQSDAQSAVQIFDHDALLELGTLVAPSGSVRPHARALHVRLSVQGELRSEMVVPGGSIRRLPLGTNERGKLEVYPARGLGVGRRGRGGIAEVRGGALGVIIDARGRPLALPVDDDERRQLLESWQQEIEEG